MATDAAPSTEPPAFPSARPSARHDGRGWSWHRLIDTDEVPEGRVTTVTSAIAAWRSPTPMGCIGALDNRCPHQGGPLGEGSIEKGWLRCPWHGYDYSPCNGAPPPGFDDAPTAYPTEVRDDGVYVALPDDAGRAHRLRRAGRDDDGWGVHHVFGMVGHSNLGFADAMRRPRSVASSPTSVFVMKGAAAFAASAYGKLTGRPAACFGIAGPGSTNLLTGLYDAKVDSAPVLAISGSGGIEGEGTGAFQDLDLDRCSPTWPPPPRRCTRTRATPS
jgi:pyruvate oxidase